MNHYHTCGLCESSGNGEPGSSPPETLCRLCGRAWSQGIPNDAAWPEVAWWVVFEPEDVDLWDPDNTTGHGGVPWSLYEWELAEPVMMFVAGGSTRSEVLHLLDMILTVIAERRHATDPPKGWARSLGDRLIALGRGRT